MKVWIDILTPKELLFFAPMAKKLRKKHEVTCTGRKYRELTNLSKIYKFGLKSVGRHGGKLRESKLRASISRMKMLQGMMEKQRPDLVVSFCSPEAARVAYGLGINHIGYNDAAHETAHMKLSVPFLQKLLIPRFIPKSAFARYGIAHKDIIRYNAIDGAMTLRYKVPPGQKPPFPRNKKVILIRTEEEQAAYLLHKKVGLDGIIERLIQDHGDKEIVILPRYAEQIKRLRGMFGKRARVLADSYDGKLLLTNSDVFIGSGGTMTTEAGLLGIPTIFYNAVPNVVLSYMTRKNLVKMEEDPGRISRLVEKMLRDDRAVYVKRAKMHTQSMEDPYDTLLNAIKLLK